jgi:hypothetical protein
MKKLVVAGCLVLALCAWGSFSYAYTYEFGDSVRYWEGWRNYTGDDSKDTIGDPNILGGKATIENGNLTKIEFTIEKWGTGSTWNKLKPGDLFLDLGADASWDYVVSLNQQTTAGDYLCLRG